MNPTPKPVNQEVIVGKDILDLLSGAMYIDPLVIYREYIQNSADAIDLAIAKGLDFEEPPGVQIYIDHAGRSVKIRDNGISLPFSEFVQRLISVGASQKRGMNLRGFRGVGRLSGLGYCQELIFRGRAEGNAKVTEIRWNGRILREKFRDPNYNGSLAQIIQEATTVIHVSPQGFPNRFFEVELIKIARLKNDVLLNEDVVRNYLSQVAPVPFEDQIIASQINDELSKYGIKPAIHIEIMDGKGPIYHRLKTEIEYSPLSKDKIQGIEFFELNGTNGEKAAIGWIAHHTYLGSIPKKLGLGGFRLRAGNIQVGDDSIASALFPEPRFSGWAIGEIHIISTKILPNGRRDDFEPSPSYAHIQNELAIKAREISQRIRTLSAKRNRIKSVTSKLASINSWVAIDSEQKLPPFLRNILLELANEQFQKSVTEHEKLSSGKDDYSTHDLIEKTKASIDSVLARPSTNSNAPYLSKEVAIPIASAIKTIISASKTPQEGIKLSLEVLEAINKGS